VKATAQKPSALTGEILHPKPAGFRPHCDFSCDFPIAEAPSSNRLAPSPISLRPSPFFRYFCNAKALVPTGCKAVLTGPVGAPIFSAIFPIAPMIFPNFQAIFPNVSPAALICNCLFPSHLLFFVARRPRSGRRDGNPSSVGRVSPRAVFPSSSSRPSRDLPSNSKLKIKH
jgi:hypothetical protein